MDDRARYEAADRQHTLVQSFFPRIDGKGSALFAVASGELAVLCLNVTRSSLTTWWTAIPLATAALMICVSVVFLYRSAFPHLDGGNTSLIYFAEVAKRTEAGFLTDWKAADAESLLNETLAQVWANSVIVNKKFKHLKTAAILLAFSLLPWGAYLGATSFLTSQMVHIS